jgi:hypothetical protein
MMENKTARQFLEHLCNDASLRTQYRATGAKSMNDILDFALAKGYSLTDADVRAALKDVPDHVMIDQLCELLKIPRPKSAPTP